MEGIYSHNLHDVVLVGTRLAFDPTPMVSHMAYDPTPILG